jgi:hypothetical protein
VRFFVEVPIGMLVNLAYFGEGCLLIADLEIIAAFKKLSFILLHFLFGFVLH